MTIRHDMASTYGTFSAGDTIQAAWGNDINDSLDDKISKTNSADQSIASALAVTGQFKPAENMFRNLLFHVDEIVLSSGSPAIAGSDSDTTFRYWNLPTTGDRVRIKFLVHTDTLRDGISAINLLWYGRRMGNDVSARIKYAIDGGAITSLGSADQWLTGGTDAWFNAQDFGDDWISVTSGNTPKFIHVFIEKTSGADAFRVAQCIVRCRK